MAEPPLENLDPHGRRQFLSIMLWRFLRPLAGFIEKKLLPAVSVPLPPSRPLRPPGALEESRFLNTCQRCARCAEACPAHAIVLSDSTDPWLRGAPFVDPDRQACVICDELACMRVCPSGALSLVDRFAIRMGLAVVDQDVCVRSKGEPCTICIDKCPIAAVAIRLDDSGRIQVIDPHYPGDPGLVGQGCTGCGVCQQHCPTSPVKAIRVMPY
jgi:MauM/NapG family ferredoxin protein